MTFRALCRSTLVLFCAAALAAAGSGARGADWPAYRNGPARRACTSEQIAAPLVPQWRYLTHAEPSPAWPEPVRELHMMNFDYAFQPVAAGGVVYFGSSTDHQVHALDLATGRQRWTFHTDGPVRFAPAVSKGKVYVASDDGCVYCLSPADGRLIWRFRAADDDRVIGNEQMISRWPLRSGLLVADGVVHFTAGMWPNDGVWVFALHAKDGKVIRKVKQDAGFAPQGYLTRGPAALLAPTGRTPMWNIDPANGSAKRGRGYTWAMVAGGMALAGHRPFKGNESLPITGSPQRPPRRESLTVWPVAGKGKMRNIAGKGPAAADDTTCYTAGEGTLAACALDTFAKKWEVPLERTFALAVAGKTVIAGGENTVTLLSAETGKRLWSGKAAGDARGLAVADGRLLVSTHTGRIHCFGAKALGKPTPKAPTPVPTDPKMASLAKRIMTDTQVTAGFCLVAGAGDGRLVLELARHSRLRIYCADGDKAKVAAARKLLTDADLYGDRVTVHHIAGPDLPYPAYFADLIVVDGSAGASGTYSPAALGRVLHPCGGVAWRGRSGGPADEGGPWIRGEALTQRRISPTTECVVRGKLPGAGDWTHLYGDTGNSGSSGDSRVKWPLKMLWFGKPGPGRMMQRHWRGTAPVVADGRMFVLGQHSIIATDAYNGRELWSHRMPSIARRVVDIRGGNMALDGDSLYVSTGDLCLRFEAATGDLLRTYRIPVRRPRLVIAREQTFAMGEAGEVSVRAERDALVLALRTKDANVVNAHPAGNPARGDSWELFFDFRPADKRTGVYGSGAFQAIVPATAPKAGQKAWQSGPWSTCPPIDVTGKVTTNGSLTTVRIAWREIVKLVGAKPPDFTFGAILNSSDDGMTLTGRAYKFANAASYRLANARATLVLEAPRQKAKPQTAALPDSEKAEPLAWGQLYVSGDVILATVAEQGDSPAALQHGWDFSSENNDYTGPPVAKVLGIIGVRPETRYVFALSKSDGGVLWVRKAAGAFPHNAVAVGGDRVYLIDRAATPKADPAARKRRGAKPQVGPATLEALDLATARRLWRIDEGLDDYRQLRMGRGVLLAASMSGMTAFDAEHGAKLWSVARRQSMHHCSAFLRAPLITSKWIYDEPYAYDLRTGKPRAAQGAASETVPAAGMAGTEEALWQWKGGTGCGTVSAAENMLFFRNRNPFLLDTAGGTGGHAFGGIRPGCYINIVAAGGLVLMPEAASGCGCPYNFQTTVVMMPQ